jgi:hypothetical protein
MGLFGFDVGSRASDKSCVLKNLDCHSVSKNHDSGTKPGGDMKPRPGESRKNQSVWCDSHVSPLRIEKKANPNTPYRCLSESGRYA